MGSWGSGGEGNRGERKGGEGEGDVEEEKEVDDKVLRHVFGQEGKVSSFENVTCECKIYR